MNSKVKYLIVILILLFISACGTVSPLKSHYENHFTDLKIPERDKIKVSSIKKSYQISHKQVWDSSLSILVQHSLILKTYSESGIIFYLDIDGVFFKNKFSYMEFPFSVLVEKELENTVVYVYPMVEFFEGNISEEKLKIMKMAFSQKAEEFLEELSIQMTAQTRWPWLVK